MRSPMQCVSSSFQAGRYMLGVVASVRLHQSKGVTATEADTHHDCKAGLTVHGRKADRHTFTHMRLMSLLDDVQIGTTRDA